jgi:hypothetical protein
MHHVDQPLEEKKASGDGPDTGTDDHAVERLFRELVNAVIGGASTASASTKVASVVDVLVLLDLARIGSRLSRAYRIALRRRACAAGQDA